jgi:hypothetical protein
VLDRRYDVDVLLGKGRVDGGPCVREGVLRGEGREVVWVDRVGCEVYLSVCMILVHKRILSSMVPYNRSLVINEEENNVPPLKWPSV